MWSRRLVVRGFTLIEMLIAVVIIGVAVAGVLAVFRAASRGNADPVEAKQMLSVAEEMMDEVLLEPFAVSGVAPTNVVVSCGAAGASRVSFDDVADFNNYQTNGACDPSGVAVSGLEGYGVRVTVATQAWQGIAAADSYLITVTVTHGVNSLALVGRRTNYAR